MLFQGRPLALSRYCSSLRYKLIVKQTFWKNKLEPIRIGYLPHPVSNNGHFLSIFKLEESFHFDFAKFYQSLLEELCFAKQND